MDKRMPHLMIHDKHMIARSVCGWWMSQKHATWDLGDVICIKCKELGPDVEFVCAVCNVEGDQ